MGVLHFLDVGDGDCSIIQHVSGRNTVIDVCKARRGKKQSSLSAFDMLFATPSPLPRIEVTPKASDLSVFDTLFANPSPLAGSATNTLLGMSPKSSGTVLGNALASAMAADDTAENPIRYMRDRGINDVFRFVATHPDMDHLDGIKDFFEEFRPANFWDTANTRQMKFEGNRFREEDWEFYKALRDGKLANAPRRLALHAGARGPYYNERGDSTYHDGLYILAPTPALVASANETEDFNDASYVILYKTTAGRMLFCGDSHDATWEYILENHLSDIQNVELMIAPHHGRDSDRNREFLSKVMPRLTLFGCGPSKHMAYDAWRNRGLDYIPGNQSGTVVVDTDGGAMHVFAANESFARRRNNLTFYSSAHRAWWVSCVMK